MKTKALAPEAIDQHRWLSCYICYSQRGLWTPSCWNWLERVASSCYFSCNALFIFSVFYPNLKFHTMRTINYTEKAAPSDMLPPAETVQYRNWRIFQNVLTGPLTIARAQNQELSCKFNEVKRCLNTGRIVKWTESLSRSNWVPRRRSNEFHWISSIVVEL